MNDFEIVRKSQDKIVKDRAWELLSALTSLVWCIEHDMHVAEAMADARQLRDEIKDARKEAWR